MSCFVSGEKEPVDKPGHLYDLLLCFSAPSLIGYPFSAITLLKPYGKSLMRMTFVHHCFCPSQMNFDWGRKWQSEMYSWLCGGNIIRSDNDRKLFSPASVHSGAVRSRGFLCPCGVLRRYVYSDMSRSWGSRTIQKTSAD